MSQVVTDASKAAYIAYVKEKGFRPKNATQLLHFSKRHDPPGINYKAARNIVAHPPLTSLEDDCGQSAAHNPYIDDALKEHFISGDKSIATSSNMETVYNLYKEKNGSYPSNASRLLSFCKLNDIHVTYSECSQFISSQCKDTKKMHVRKRKNKSHSPSELEEILKSRKNTKCDITKFDSLEKPIISTKKMNDNDAIDHRGRDHIGKLEKDIVEINVKQESIIDYSGRDQIKDLEKETITVIKEDDAIICTGRDYIGHLEKNIVKENVKEESKIDYSGRSDLISLEKAAIHSIKSNEDDAIITTGRDYIGDLEKDVMEGHKEEPTDIDRATYLKQSQHKKLEAVKQSEPVAKPTFVSEDTFSANMINCSKVNGVDLSDKFIHIDIDDGDAQQLQNAVTVAATRAFQCRFVPPVVDIVKGKAFGEMIILLPSGLTHKYAFNGQRTVYRGRATFKTSDTGSQTFTCCVYYEQSRFNPIRRAHNVDSSHVCFMEELKHIRCSIDSNVPFNALCEEAAKKLQHKYLSKMDERNKTNKAYHSDTIPDSDILQIATTGPKEASRAYFTGLLLGGTYQYNYISVPYQIDDFSEYVGQGEYPRNTEAFPKAVAGTFDGIAIDRNTRVIIYEKENFQGNILLDARGPKIVNNGIHKNYAPYNNCNTETFPDAELQKNFPVEVRMWTETNMHQWSYGSVKILSNYVPE